MLETTEIRVRPVTRHQITCWNPSGIRTIGEYANAVLADEAARGLKALYPEAQLVDSEGEVSRPTTTKYVLVQHGVFTPECLVYHADAESLERTLAELAATHYGVEFRVFSSPSGQLPAPPDLHTSYPARHAIGDIVIRRKLGCAPAWRAKVAAVKFYPGKVRYDLEGLDGDQHAEPDADSCDVLPATDPVEIGGI